MAYLHFVKRRDKAKVWGSVHSYCLPAVNRLQGLLKGAELGQGTKRQNDHTADPFEGSRAASSFALSDVVLELATSAASGKAKRKLQIQQRCLFFSQEKHFWRMKSLIRIQQHINKAVYRRIHGISRS